MDNQKYSLHIGHELMNDVTLADLRALQTFLNDFLQQEEDLPLASGVPAPASSAAGKPLVFKNVYFDSDSRRFNADFNIYAEGDSLTGLSGEGLIDLYHTLRAFLARSEKVLKEELPEAEAPAERPRRKITITPQHPGDPMFPKETTSLCKRISLYGQDEVLRSDYVLSTPFGSFYRMSRGDLEALSGEISAFLHQSAG